MTVEFPDLPPRYSWRVYVSESFGTSVKVKIVWSWWLYSTCVESASSWLEEGEDVREAGLRLARFAHGRWSYKNKWIDRAEEAGKLQDDLNAGTV